MSGKIKAAAIRSESSESNNAILAIVNGEGSKSSKIRELFALGIEKTTIATLLDIRYQHVRNVLVTKLTGKPQKIEVPKMTEEHLAG